VKSTLRLLGLALALAAPAGGAAAQNLVISNARIIVGPGRTIENGSVVVQDGKIASVSPGRAAAPRGTPTVDGTGMTVIAGYIDVHRHIMSGAAGQVDRWLAEAAPKAMMELLESGVTTVQSGGDDNVGILELKRRVESGQIKGPRIVTSYRINTVALPNEEVVRAEIRKARAAGADSIAEQHHPGRPSPPWPFNPTEQETKNLAAGIDEAVRQGFYFQIHAISDQSLTAAVHIGARKLIHSVNINFVSNGQAKEVARTGAQVASITGFGSPNFDVFSKDNKPKFRDGKDWPSGIVDSQGVGQEAGYMPVNLRTLYDNGVDVAYATDTTFYAPAALAHELKTLNLVFSVPDLVKILGPNSAKFLNKDKEIGTIEPGKFADFLVLGGNPYDGYWYFLNPVVVVKGGQIVIDKRGQPDAGKPHVRYGY
jgi:imidazolonepropionase-like amidohydrolase